ARSNQSDGERRLPAARLSDNENSKTAVGDETRGVQSVNSERTEELEETECPEFLPRGDRLEEERIGDARLSAASLQVEMKEGRAVGKVEVASVLETANPIAREDFLASRWQTLSTAAPSRNQSQGRSARELGRFLPQQLAEELIKISGGFLRRAANLDSQLTEPVQAHDRPFRSRVRYGTLNGPKKPPSLGLPVTFSRSPCLVSFGSTNSSFGSCHSFFSGGEAGLAVSGFFSSWSPLTFSMIPSFELDHADWCLTFAKRERLDATG